jgi:hypothetical protein
MFGVEKRRDLFLQTVKESSFKPDPTAYNLDTAFKELKRAAG